MLDRDMCRRSGKYTPPPGVKWYRAALVDYWRKRMLTRREVKVLMAMMLGFDEEEIGKLLRLKREQIAGALRAAKHRIARGMTVAEQMAEVGYTPRRRVMT